MPVRISEPFESDEQKLFLVVHGGYDFDPTVISICSSKEKAEEMLMKHYENPAHYDFPWNGCWILEAQLNNWIRYSEEEKEEAIKAKEEEYVPNFKSAKI